MKKHFLSAARILCALILPGLLCAGLSARAQGIPRTARVTDMKDVPAGAYYAEAVDWALVNGIANGTGTDTFSPEQICTRAHVVTFLWRA
ncbi:MAG: S-layer homology domain-containing protein, partial [Oscillospiraceae bacterium]|nr:S-layer homology domain-containing protein [Oscillospiraceae bacterium]